MLASERTEVRTMLTLARRRFSENDGIPCGVIILCSVSLSLSLMRDAMSQTVVQNCRHGSQDAKVGTGRNKRSKRSRLFRSHPRSHVILVKKKPEIEIKNDSP